MIFSSASIRSRSLLLMPLLFFFVKDGSIAEGQTTDVPAAAHTVGEWNRYRLKDGEFSVLLPAPPALSSYKRTYKLGATDSHQQHIIGAYSSGTAYSVHVFETNQSLDEFIISSPVRVGEFKRNLNGFGLKGKEYGYDDSGLKGLTRFLASKKRIYVFSAYSSMLVKDPDGNLFKFFESISFERPNDGNVIAEGPSQAQFNYSAPAGKEDDSSIFSGKQVTNKARVISKPEPTYTDGARSAQVTGTVVLRVVFSATGEVTNIREVSGLPEGLTGRAVGVARQIKFIPAIKDGRFVSMYIQLEYNFNLY